MKNFKLLSFLAIIIFFLSSCNSVVIKELEAENVELKEETEMCYNKSEQLKNQVRTQDRRIASLESELETCKKKSNEPITSSYTETSPTTTTTSYTTNGSYTIQVSAHDLNKPVNDYGYFEYMKDKIVSRTASDYIRYTYSSFNSIEEAEAELQNVIRNTKFKDAYVRAIFEYNNL